MTPLACNGATILCSMGTAPSTLVVLPVHQVLATAPAANIMDHRPFLNVLPFGMCRSMANPAVAAATAAALGVFTPAPCAPLTPLPWVPGAGTFLIGGFPALDMRSRLTCMWGGSISLLSPGQTQVVAP